MYIEYAAFFYSITSPFLRYYLFFLPDTILFFTFTNINQEIFYKHDYKYKII